MKIKGREISFGSILFMIMILPLFSLSFAFVASLFLGWLLKLFGISYEITYVTFAIIFSLLGLLLFLMDWENLLTKPIPPTEEEIKAKAEIDAFYNAIWFIAEWMRKNQLNPKWDQNELNCAKIILSKIGFTKEQESQCDKDKRWKGRFQRMLEIRIGGHKPIDWDFNQWLENFRAFYVAESLDDPEYMDMLSKSKNIFELPPEERAEWFEKIGDAHDQQRAKLGKMIEELDLKDAMEKVDVDKAIQELGLDRSHMDKYKNDPKD